MNFSPSDFNFGPLGNISGFAGAYDLDSTGLAGMPSAAFPAKTGSSVVPSVGGLAYDPGKLGLNVPTLNLALSGLGTLGSLWAGFKQLNLANKTFNMQKKFGEANLANSIKSYNTTLADRSRARAAFEGQSAAEAQAYVDKNKL